jgi:hypothetical protein
MFEIPGAAMLGANQELHFTPRNHHVTLVYFKSSAVRYGRGFDNARRIVEGDIGSTAWR